MWVLEVNSYRNTKIKIEKHEQSRQHKIKIERHDNEDSMWPIKCMSEIISNKTKYSLFLESKAN
jgi:hypothetical protein